MENKGNRGGKWIAFFNIIIILVLLPFCFASTPKCNVSGCRNERMTGYSYCYIHKPKYHKYTNTNSGSSSYSKWKGTTGSGTNSYSSGKSRYGTSTYKSLDYDPDDYDSPEDYADDAWGNDFDDWDEAYDYWENY